ncbi:MAG: AsmA family protein [Sedimentisphaerales bacterium]
MKKSLKAVWVILLAVLILAAVVAIAIDVFAERALKAGIEVAATKALNVGVSVGKVDLSIMAGKLGISNLLINNPPGYQYNKLLELKNAQIEVDVKSLLSERVNIRRIRLDGVNVVLEQRITNNNLLDVVKTISNEQEVKGKPEKRGGKKLHIDNLEISNVIVKAKLLPIPGKADTITLELDPIVMTDLGSDNKLDTAELSSKILLAIAAGVAEKGTGVLPDEMTSTMKSTLGKTIELGKTATKEGKKLLEGGKDSGKELIEGFKGLLKKPKEEK